MEIFLFTFVDITSVANARLEEFLVSDHEFKALNQFEVNQTYFKCKTCNINDSWSRLVFVSQNLILQALKYYKINMTHYWKKGVVPQNVSDAHQ